MAAPDAASADAEGTEASAEMPTFPAPEGAPEGGIPAEQTEGQHTEGRTADGQAGASGDTNQSGPPSFGGQGGAPGEDAGFPGGDFPGGDFGFEGQSRGVDPESVVVTVVCLVALAIATVVVIKF